MKLLLIGRNGQLATEILKQAGQHDVTVHALSRNELDLSEPQRVVEVLSAVGDVDIVLIAAAYTAVDKAEADHETAFRVNAESVREIGRFCNQRNLPLIHVSTDYVFDGSREGYAYQPGDPVAPTGVYGASKLAGERALAETHAQSVIVRTSWIYSPHGHNFVKTMLKVGADRDELRIVSDQHGCPTSAADLAAALLSVARRVLEDPVPECWGVFHFCGAGATSWFGFSREIFDLAARRGFNSPRLVPVSTAEYPTPAKRPANSVLDCARIGEIYGISPRPWGEALAETIEVLMNSAQLETS
ncbi:dTDP-4-dehydrorhamnose reductase [uncultured Maricaulis sp.]|mgnify:CR=1 FL=1|uniref:dTDP-4-dehydrorhamnose reductase n=1 Tax=uncultured Maricaulis sp. TaxID=174710 RepID=UPI0030D8E9B9|tara:strand:- start:50954 stop:51859 length:906 start_codon:yes stop_codon:yes gene_type:complete